MNISQHAKKKIEQNLDLLLLLSPQKIAPCIFNPEGQFTVYNNHLPVLRVTIHHQNVWSILFYRLAPKMKIDYMCRGGGVSIAVEMMPIYLSKNNQIYSGKSPAIYAKRSEND